MKNNQPLLWLMLPFLLAACVLLVIYYGEYRSYVALFFAVTALIGWVILYSMEGKTK